jgi:putative membrane protein
MSDQENRHGRWPRWVYGADEEPDYRFSFANERTFLAWIRTAIALLAGGVAVDTLKLAIPHGVQQTLAALLVSLGLVCALASWFRWAKAERAMRRREPLPASLLSAVLTSALVLAAAALLVAAF